MNKNLYGFLKRMEETVGTHKFMKCICIGGIGFLMAMLMLPDDVQKALIENNKEEF